MPFDKVIEHKHLRWYWAGSDKLPADWRFVEFSSRHGTLFVRVDVPVWTYYLLDGSVASPIQISTVRGRGKTADRLIQEKIDASVSSRKTPASGNPYGRFPEGTEVGVLGFYEDMSEIDFLQLSDGLGMRMLDEGFISIYNGCPATLTDEWGRNWTRIADRSEYRPWAVYVRDIHPIIPTALPVNDAVVAAAATCGLPVIEPLHVFSMLDRKRLEVISTLNRKSFDSQKKVMKNNSAREVATLLGLPTVNVDWEWLHLVAFSLGGHQGNAQIPQNLVLGTAGANTAMMIVEGFVKKTISRGIYDAATVIVSREAPVHDCGWFCTSINYLIKFECRSSGTRPVYVRERFDPFLLTAPDFVIAQMSEQMKSHKLHSGPPPRPVSDTRTGAHGYRSRRL